MLINFSMYSRFELFLIMLMISFFINISSILAAKTIDMLRGNQN